jgi:ADP-heptose:LPS heptosyltransferase
MRMDAIDLAGRTDLDALAALLAGARLVLVNDTGVSHLAAAVETPSVVAFMVTDPARWAPLDGDLHRALVRPSVVDVLREAGELLTSGVASRPACASSPGTSTR